MKSYKIIDHEYDVVVLGAGGSGLRAAVGLSEVRHWFWDIGLGFELKTTKITGLLVIFGSFLLTILIYSSRGFLQL